MKRYLFLSIVTLVVALQPLHAQETKTPQMRKLFRDVVAEPSQCTVRVLAGGKEAALGTVITADGWVLTKHSELKGKVTCKLHDGTECDAELVGFDVPFDLAMLKVDAQDLTPVKWCDSKVSRVGHWVASVGTGQEPVAIGVLSVASREVKGTKKFIPQGSNAGYLGFAYDLNFAGVKVEEVYADKPAAKAGLKVGDQILAIKGESVDGVDEFRALLSKYKPLDEITLKVLRDDKEIELKATLGTAPGAKGGKSRGDLQNNMGSKLSDRRTGFPIILQHDSVLRPTDCGGPLCNLDGQVIGINIARAGRTESYAIPSEAVRPLLEKLKTKKKDKTP